MKNETTYRKDVSVKGEAVLDVNGEPLVIQNRVEGEWFSPEPTSMGDLIDKVTEVLELTRRVPFPIRDIELRTVDIVETRYFEEVLIPEVREFDMSDVFTTRTVGRLYGEARLSGNIISQQTTIESFYEARAIYYTHTAGAPVRLRTITSPNQ